MYFLSNMFLPFYVILRDTCFKNKFSYIYKYACVFVCICMKDQLCSSHLASHVHWRPSSQVGDSMPELNKFTPHIYSKTVIYRDLLPFSQEALCLS
jgi:hypothetical protein